jgi:hypothetical protein
MKRVTTSALFLLVAVSAAAQPWIRRPTGPDYPTGNKIIEAIWDEGMNRSQVGDIDLNVPGSPDGGGSDYAAFICAGAPAFSLSSASFDYGTATWHTNRNTFDKLSIEDVKRNATVTAMLTYLASEDETMPHDRRDLGNDPETGEPREWPACEDSARRTTERFR